MFPTRNLISIWTFYQSHPSNHHQKIQRRNKKLLTFTHLFCTERFLAQNIQEEEKFSFELERNCVFFLLLWLVYSSIFSDILRSIFVFFFSNALKLFALHKNIITFHEIFNFTHFFALFLFSLENFFLFFPPKKNLVERNCRFWLERFALVDSFSH